MGVTIYFDGACEPKNPGGTATYGLIIEREGHGAHDGPIYHESGVIGTGKGMTNNVAEYTALLKALEWLEKKGKLYDIYPNEPLVIKGDSMLVINQLKDIWAVRSETSRHFVPKIKHMLKKWKDVRLIWIPREQNLEADRLSKEAYKVYIETKDKRKTWR